MFFSPDSNIGKRALPVTRFIIENEYQSRLTLEKNETEIMVSSLMQQSQMGILPSNDELLADALARLEEIKAQQEQMDQLVTGDMALMLVLAIVFIYLVMVAQFQSLKSPFIVMFTIPRPGGKIGSSTSSHQSRP